MVDQDYVTLNSRVSAEIRRMKEQFPDFSTKGLMIDDMMTESELHCYAPEMVVSVAAEHGFDIKVCRFGENCATHENPRVRANGVWLEMPKNIEERFERGGSYASLEDVTYCPQCESAQHRISREVNRMSIKLKESGNGDIMRFGCFPHLSYFLRAHTED